MSARSRGLIWGVALALGGGCGGAGEAASGDAAEARSPSNVDPAVTVAQAIRANATATDSILVAHGLTRDGFDSLMYDVAEDARRAQAYAEAMRQ